MDYCKDCDKFRAYETKNGKNPDNCVLWLCNCGKCPNDKAIKRDMKAGKIVKVHDNHRKQK